MAVRNYARGSLNPVVYFENSKGDLALPPTTEDALRIKDRMKDRGYELREAGTLSEIDRLQKRLQDIEKRRAEMEGIREEYIIATARKRTRDRLISIMVSDSTSPYERDFIKHYLLLRDEKKDKWKSRFGCDISYFIQREYSEQHARQHLQDSVDAVPEMKDEACPKCRNFRKMKGQDLCARCASGS